jgi:hypothetical protein
MSMNKRGSTYRYGYFLGIKQHHNYWLYKIIEDILNENKQIKGIIEIGTAEGALSMLLGLECYVREFKPLLTYDIEKKKEPKLFKLLGIKSIIRDCFNEKSIQEIKEYADSPILLICDGGNKAKEFNTFIPYLKSGSIIAVHDWNSRLKLEDIIDTVSKYNLKPLHEDKWDSPPDYIKTCFWRKV